ncbi:MFS transporter [Actinoplanes sp. NPDC051851]|uniref:MFS transporter n=1 Tax=Actinoplanes sp. NPDC051851 TaxID=3154753 RepID=UPI003432FD9D
MKAQHPGLVLATACVCQVLVVLDVTLVNVALPSVATDLDIAPASLSWVVNAYTLALGGLLLLGGRFADLVGHRVAMLVGLVVFAIASVFGGVAQSPAELIAARAGQGVAGAILAPLSLTVLMVAFAEGKARSRAIGIWSMVAAGGSALGVLLGGILTESLSWRWVLLINVPIALAALLLAIFSVRNTHTARGGRLDVAGAILVTLSVSALVNGTIQAAGHGWGSSYALLSFLIAILAGAAFAAWELRVAATPLVRFGVFRARSVWVAQIVILFIGGATVAGFYFASLYLQDVLHYTPIEAGAAFLPFCFGSVLGAMSSAPLAARFGRRTVMTAGLLFGSAGMYLFSLADADSTFAGGFLPPSILASIGIGLCMVATTTMATTGVAEHEAGLTSGLLNAGRQIGGSLSLAALTTVAVSASTHSTALDAEHALAAGYSRAFLVTAAFILVAALAAATLTPPTPAPQKIKDKVKVA